MIRVFCGNMETPPCGAHCAVDDSAGDLGLSSAQVAAADPSRESQHIPTCTCRRTTHTTGKVVVHAISASASVNHSGDPDTMEQVKFGACTVRPRDGT